jgi:chromosome segregation protein
VTLDGQVINAGGSFTGGSVKKTEGIISRKQELADLQKQLDSLSAELEPLKIKHDTLNAECAKMKLECEGMSENLTKFSGEQMRLNAEISGVADMLGSFTEILENSQATLSRCRSKIAEEQAIIDTNTAELSRITKELAESEKSAFEKCEQLEKFANRRREIAETVSELNDLKLIKNKDIESLNGQITSLDSARVKSSESRELSLSEITELETANTELEAKIAQKLAEIEKIDSSLSAVKQEITELIAKSESLEKRGNEINTEIREKMSHKEKFTTSYTRAAERKVALEQKSEEIKATLYDDYELTPSEAIELARANNHEITDIKQTKSKLNEIKKKLVALGTVNYAAVEEFEEVSIRYKELSVQLDDVRKAKSELEKLIAELTGDIRTRFLESFNDINKHFTRIFSEVFGWTARLELTECDDVLNSGIEIYAAPPGKVIKSLMGLSGGEKALVAITLYFAILRHRPTPFCMLDEVDAALDAVNAVTYINYLKRYAETTQLMMITHRRETIEGCDVLYGVFMQEKGVSRLIKQEIK